MFLSLFVCLSVCLFVGLLKKLPVNFPEMFGKGRPLDKKQLVRFWTLEII